MGMVRTKPHRVVMARRANVLLVGRLAVINRDDRALNGDVVRVEEIDDSLFRPHESIIKEKPGSFTCQRRANFQSFKAGRGNPNLPLATASQIAIASVSTFS